MALTWLRWLHSRPAYRCPIPLDGAGRRIGSTVGAYVTDDKSMHSLGGTPRTAWEHVEKPRR